MHAKTRNLIVTLVSIYLILFVLPEGTVLASLTGLRLIQAPTYLGIAMPETLPYPTSVSNWRVVSSDGLSFPVGNAVAILEQGMINTAQPVVLTKGDKIVLMPGPSPVGVSFRRNMCSGYLGQFQEFTPPLPRDCPAANTTALAPECATYVATIPRCEIPVNGLRLNQMDALCKTFVTEKINYSSCVDDHRDDTSFAENEWRIYPTPTITSWSESSTYKLLDESGHLVGIFSPLSPEEVK